MSINVLSLFDGMSCGQLALERAGINVNNYYASEIDKFAIKIAMKNYPNTIQIGDVENVKAIDLPKIDLLVGGSPCQGFSSCGNQLNFKDPRSALFFEYVRILKECKPKYFLLENVKMKKEWQDIISENLNVKPIEIDSNLVSAQNRKRLYWTNILNIQQPKDKGVFLNDIVESPGIGVIKVHGVLKERILKSQCLDANYHKGVDNHGARTMIKIGEARDIKSHDLMKRIYSTAGKSPTLNACTGGNREPKINVGDNNWRKLTPIECERLQTVPDNYTATVSNTQRYKMLGNGWTVDVLAHIFKEIKFSIRHIEDKCKLSIHYKELIDFEDEEPSTKFNSHGSAIGRIT